MRTKSQFRLFAERVMRLFPDLDESAAASFADNLLAFEMAIPDRPTPERPDHPMGECQVCDARFYPTGTEW